MNQVVDSISQISLAFNFSIDVYMNKYLFSVLVIWVEENCWWLSKVSPQWTLLTWLNWKCYQQSGAECSGHSSLQSIEHSYQRWMCETAGKAQLLSVAMEPQSLLMSSFMLLLHSISISMVEECLVFLWPKVVEWLTLYIREVLVSHLSSETGCPDRFFLYFSVPPGRCLDSTSKLDPF